MVSDGLINMVKSFTTRPPKYKTRGQEKVISPVGQGSEGVTQGQYVKREGATHIIPPSTGMKSPEGHVFSSHPSLTHSLRDTARWRDKKEQQRGDNKHLGIQFVFRL